MLPVIAMTQTSRVVTGTVRDGGGFTMPGVNVFIQGTTIGTVTDIAGNFSLEVQQPESAILVFSFIGFDTKEVLVGTQTAINLVMTEYLIGLDEVVAVGYGTMRRSDLTGSIASVEGNALQARGTTTVMGALQGAVAGVNITSNSARPGGGFDIRIRGQNTLNAAGATPLFVVDGIVTDNINFLNPADIIRIDILKDASSTAIYGSRGSNGVVIVQTKKADDVREGVTTVTYDGFLGERRVARMPDFMDGWEFLSWRTSQFYRHTPALGLHMTAADQTTVLQGSDFLRQRLLNNDFTDWPSLVTRDGQQQNHFLTIASSANDFAYVLGIGYQSEDGNMIGEYLDMYNVKLSVQHNASDFFSSGGSVNMSLSENSLGSEHGYRDGFRQNPLMPAFDDQGFIIPQPGIAASIQGAGNFTSSPNPLLEIANGIREIRRFDVLGNFFMSVRPIDGIEFRSTFAPRLVRVRDGYYYGAIAGERTHPIASQDTREIFDFTWDNVLNHSFQINGIHQLTTTLINSFHSVRAEGLRAGSERLPFDSQWYNIGSGTLLSTLTGSSYEESTMLSFAGRVNYSLLDRYLLTATLRYDGASRLAQARWESFPSLAFAWRISEEHFMVADWLSNLKLRLSYGFTGNNSGVAPFGTQVSPITGTLVWYDFNGTPISGFAPGLPVNTMLTWEKTREYNIGLDFGIFRNRINGAIDIYDKLSDGLIMDRRLAIEAGVASMRDNIGSVSNKGIEIALNTVNVKSRNVNWTTSFTFARNKMSIEELYGGRVDDVGNRWFIGHPINVVYDFVFDGVWTPEMIANLTPEQITNFDAIQGRARFRDLNDDGLLTVERDMRVLGSRDPDWTGGFSSNLQAFGFDFSFNLHTHQGVFVDSPFLREFGFTTDRGRNRIDMNFYIPEGLPVYDRDVNWTTSTANWSQEYPAPRNAGARYAGSGIPFYTDASFVKVRNITLGYTLPQNLVNRAYIQSFRVYFNVLNPFTWTDYKGYDPEFAHISLGGGNGPTNITYQVGVNVKF